MVRPRCHVCQPVAEVLANHVLRYSVEHIAQPAEIGNADDWPLVVQVH